ncbi:DHH family phosphoesterase [Thermofilum pendens]
MSKLLESREWVLVVSHYDADGLSSLSLMLYFLWSHGVPFHARLVEQVDPRTLEELPLGEYDYAIFLDLGSGYKHLIERYAEGKNILLIDHHVPSSPKGEECCVEINPYRVGLNGSEEASASTLTYLLLRSLDEKVEKMVHVALVGALGDRLDLGPRYSFKGLNERVLREALDRKVVEASLGLRFFGGPKRPLVKAIARTTDPFLPGLTGNETACYNFLKKIGIEPKAGEELRTVGSLSSEEVKKLATELVKYMLSAGLSVKDAQKIIGYNYYLASEKPESPLRDLREYAYILNALGRMENYEVAVAINLGGRGSLLAIAEDVSNNYRKTLARLIESVLSGDSEKVKVYEGRISVIIEVRDANPKLTGPLSSILASLLSQKFRDKKLLGVAAPLSKEDSTLKISFRRLTEEVDIGRTLQDIAAKIGIEGGGHPAAGGAVVSRDKLKALLEHL